MALVNLMPSSAVHNNYRYICIAIFIAVWYHERGTKLKVVALMKVSQSPVSPQPKIEKKDQQHKAKETTVDLSLQENDTVSVSSRNVAVASSNETEFSTGAFDMLKSLLLGNPDEAVSAQSNSSPERVLQLLA